MLHPKQFEVNEAWLIFQLNDEPIETAEDGSFNALCLMDAASCFILSTAMVSVSQSEPDQLQARRLFKEAFAHKGKFPQTLFVPAGRFESVLPAEAARHSISVVPVQEADLAVFTGEARQGFKEHVQRPSL